MAQKKAPESASLADIEQVALQAGQRLKEAIATALLAERGQALSTDIPSMGYTLVKPGAPEKIEYGGGPRAKKKAPRK